MAKIRVNPDILKTNSSIIVTTSAGVQSMGYIIQSSSSTAPSYDGQFGPKVKAIGSEATAQANKMAISLRSQAGSLENKARAFDNADAMVVGTGFGGGLAPIQGLKNNFGILSWLQLLILKLLLNRITGDSISFVPGVNQNYPQGDILSTGLISSNIGKPQLSDDFFKTVISDGPDTNYWRHGFDGKTDSDCTWYAAEAVKKASDGKVDITKTTWRAGAYWAENAKNDNSGLVQGVDQIPQAGDVMNIKAGDSGHVAFVEKVVSINPDGSYTLIISEESANGKIPNWAIEKNVSDVSTDSRNLRWRKTITINPEEKSSTKVNFIHFDY